MGIARVDTVLEIATPEHLAFQVRLAGPARRMLAWLIDLLARGAIMLLLGLLASLVFGAVELGGFGAGVILILKFTLDWLYFVLFEIGTGGRTPGKMVLKVRVVRENGLPVTWRESFLRNLVRAADLDLGLIAMGLPPVGAAVMAFDPRFRRLGDIAAGTIVVVEERADVAAKKPLVAPPAMLEALPPTLALDREDLEAIELLVHREHMSEARREELAEIVAPVYARRMSMPPIKDPAGFLAALWARAQDPKRRMRA